MIALAAEDFADLRRWMISAAVVVLAHGALAASLLKWRELVEPADTAEAIVIDFAPISEQQVAPQRDVPAGPEQMPSEYVPEQKVEQHPVEETPPEVPAAPNPDVAVEPPNEVKQEIAQARSDFVPAMAPQTVESKPETRTLIMSYQNQINALLKRNLRYPRTAAARGRSGVAQLDFTLDRQGRVVESRIVHSAGDAELDAEALAMLHRAQPFPPPPPQLAGEQVNLTVPIRFNLK